MGLYQNPPKIYYTQNHEPKGFFVDLLNAIALKEGWQLRYVECEWEECLNQLERGEIDIMSDVAYSEERAKRFAFNEEVILSTWSVIYTSEHSPLESILDLDQKKIAILEGSIQSGQIPEVFKLFEIKPTIILSRSFDESFALVEEGKADAAIVNRYFGAINHSKYHLKESSIFLNPAALKFAFSPKKENLPLIEAIDRHMKAFKKDKHSLYYTAINQHLTIPEKFVLPTWLKLTIIVGIVLILVLIIAVFVFNTLLKKRTRKILESTKRLHTLEKEKIENYRQALYAMISMIEQRDAYTAGHSERVSQYCTLIAQEMGYSKKECDLLAQAATLHDIGKIAIPDAVLLKPERLSTLEYDIIKEHVDVGVKILEEIPMFLPLAHIIRSHHEHYDGSGSPDGLTADRIPPLSRIMMVADAFDAMTTNRIYKHKKSISEALDELVMLKRIHYHPEVVDAAITVLKTLTISDTIHQLPLTSLEKERFVYFYKDTVTDLYNAKYLESILVNCSYHDEFNTLFMISLHQFDQYNKKYGWEAGDELLKAFSSLLSDLFKETLIFRIHANDFIILLKTNSSLENQRETINQFILTNEIIADFILHRLDDDPICSYDQLQRLLRPRAS